MVDYKSTKIVKPVFETAELARAEVIRDPNLLRKLPSEVLQPRSCPRCGGQMEGLEIRTRIGYWKCSQCNYSQPAIEVSAVASDITKLAVGIGVGTIIGLGLACLFYYWFKK